MLAGIAKPIPCEPPEREKLLLAQGQIQLHYDPPGLGAFGVATYSLYAPSQYRLLDDQLKSSLPFVGDQLYDQAGIHVIPPGGGGGGPSHRGGGDGDGDEGPGGGPAPQ